MTILKKEAVLCRLMVQIPDLQKTEQENLYERKKDC